MRRGNGRRGARRRAIVLILAGAAGLAPGAAAQDLAGRTEALAGEPIDLGEAMRRARGRAPEVAAATARTHAAQARVDEAKGHRLPTLTLSESWIRTDAPADVFGLLLNQERFSFQQFVAGDPNQPEPRDGATTRIEVSLPLYSGGEIATRIEQARLADRSAGAALERTAEVAAFGAGEAYVRLVQAREQVDLLSDGLATSEAHAELARAYVEEGMLVSSELLRAEVETARLRDELAAARGRARVAEAGLSFRVGAPLDSRWSPAPLGDPPPLEDPLDRWLADADGRPDLAAARRQVEAAVLETRAVRARRLPRVGLAARYDLVDDLPFGTEGDHHALMAMASFDLFAGGRHRAAEAAARAEAEAAALEVARLAEGIRLEVHEAYLAAQTARERLATADAGVAAARETERILVERFRQGLVKTVDLLDATNARTAAESRRTSARADAHLGSLRLALAAGLPAREILSAGPAGHLEGDGGTR